MQRKCFFSNNVVNADRISAFQEFFSFVSSIKTVHGYTCIWLVFLNPLLWWCITVPMQQTPLFLQVCICGLSVSYFGIQTYTTCHKWHTMSNAMTTKKLKFNVKLLWEQWHPLHFMSVTLTKGCEDACLQGSIFNNCTNSRELMCKLLINAKMQPLRVGMGIKNWYLSGIDWIASKPSTAAPLLNWKRSTGAICAPVTPLI